MIKSYLTLTLFLSLSFSVSGQKTSECIEYYKRSMKQGIEGGSFSFTRGMNFPSMKIYCSKDVLKDSSGFSSELLEKMAFQIFIELQEADNPPPKELYPDDFFESQKSKVYWDEKDKKYALFTEKGNPLTDFEYDRPGKFNEKGVAYTSKNGTWFFIDKEGSLLDSCTAVIPGTDGNFFVYKSHKSTYYGSDGRKLPQWNWYNYIGKFEFGTAPVTKDSVWGFVFKTGKPATSFEYDEVFDGRHFGNAVAKKDGKSYLINPQTGDRLTPPKYDFILPTAKGYLTNVGGKLKEILIGQQSVAEGIFGLLDSTGRELVPPKYGSINYARKSSDLMVTRIPNEDYRLRKFGLMKSNGEVIIENVFDGYDFTCDSNLIFGINPPSDSAVIYSFAQDKVTTLPKGNNRWSCNNFKTERRNKKIYVLHENSNIFPPLRIKSGTDYEISSVDTVMYIRDTLGDIGFAGRSGKWIFKPQFISKEYFENGYFRFRKMKGVGLGNLHTGKILLPARYASIENYGNENIFWVSNENKRGFFDVRKPNKKIEFQFEEVKKTVIKDLLAIKKAGLWGFVNAEGKIVIPPKYEDVIYGDNDFEDLIEVYKDGGWHLMDKDGGFLFKNDFEKNKFWGNNLLFGFSNKQWKLFSLTGQKIGNQSFSDIKVINSEYALVQFGHYWGMIDKVGKFKILPEFESLEPAGPGRLKAFRFNMDWLIDYTGNLIRG